MGTRYTFEITIEEGNDEFWEELRNKSTNEAYYEVAYRLVDAFDDHLVQCSSIRPIKLEHSEDFPLNLMEQIREENNE